VYSSTLTVTTALGTWHSHLVWPNDDTWSIELVPRSSALAAHDRELRRWTTSLYCQTFCFPGRAGGPPWVGYPIPLQRAERSYLL